MQQAKFQTHGKLSLAKPNSLLDTKTSLTKYRLVLNAISLTESGCQKYQQTL